MRRGYSNIMEKSTSSNSRFPLLFSPLRIGPMTIPNRIVMPAMNMSYADDGYINEQLLNFYKARAIGGAGLIIIGGCYIDQIGMGIRMMIGIDDDKYIDKLKWFADEIHASAIPGVDKLDFQGMPPRDDDPHSEPTARNQDQN